MALRPFLLLLLLLAATLLITQAQGIGSSALDCCLKNRPLKKEISGVVTSYRLQGPESGCYLRAVVLITKKNRKICASPTDDTVQKLMQQLDKKDKNDKSRKKGQRPRGRPKKQRRQRA
ncbi:C-C motif chemokine 21-like [Pyrgilauda ruficollis]|uniref:C-C motif chemokine 21 n=1 Tax=Onychostruthus taczanowskii TaxID=356909 RepID=UPI001B804D0F|nr:C-C motif chemokine 21 [Onychostruthus taczanowskii]XP_041324627.1 C-C motif chemokine 21-like [Pyrgilauda ruficollis]